MITFTAHERDSEFEDIAARAEAILFVKEGFAWLALFFPLLWLIYHRMWVVFAGFVAILILLEAGVVLLGLEDGVAVISTIALSGVFALLANDLRRWTLARRGYRLVDLVNGRDRGECESKFFARWLASGGRQAKAAPKAVKHAKPAPATSNKPPIEGEEIIGLFPEPGK